MCTKNESMKLLWNAVFQLVAYSIGVVQCQGPVEDIGGVKKLAERQLPGGLSDRIEFEIIESKIDTNEDKFDCYRVTQDPESKNINVKAVSKSGLISGLYKYLRDFGDVSISWTDSTISKISELPDLCAGDGCKTLEGCSIVPYRYHLNTVTYGYTTPFYTWEDWEHLLDWAALQGVNLPLSWIGYEKILIEMFREFEFTDDAIRGFISGPAFLPWNRFGNVQGDWNATINILNTKYFENQFELQQKIMSRMRELGMTPILPAFTGFVPREIKDIHPDAKILNSSKWNEFPTEYSNVTFLDPMDPLFTQMQVSFLTKQQEYYGDDVTHFYTLDQYNENTPASGDLDRLREISSATIKALQKADSKAVWVMQGWLFHSAEEFWSNERIEAYLSGPKPGELLILDLFSESSPQWQRTKSYYGHDWIWCELHDFGQNMGLEGSLQILSQNFTEAKHQSPSSLVGVGLTMEGQEGNQIVYDALLDQAWQSEPYNVLNFTRRYIQSRYGGNVPEVLLDSWTELVDLVYTNDLSHGVTSTPKCIYELNPALYGLERPGRHSTLVFYDTHRLEQIWKNLVDFAFESPEWLSQPHFHHDIVDITRQVLSNKFVDHYHEFVNSLNNTDNPSSPSDHFTKGNRLILTLGILDDVLYTDENFLLSNWISKARALAESEEEADYMEFQARNQVTLWGPHGEVNNYGSKAWAGLVGEYYKPIWQKFIKFVLQGNDANDFENVIGKEFRNQWQLQKWFDSEGKSHKWLATGTKGDLKEKLQLVSKFLEL